MLTLLQIKATNKVDQVNLVLSDQSIIPFPIDLINSYNLSKGMEVGDDFLNKLKLASIQFIAYNYSLRLIAMSPQTSQTVNSKLNIYLKKYTFKHKYSLSKTDQAQIIQDIITTLSSKALLDDLEYAKFLIRKHSRKSKREQLYRLQLAGIDPNTLPTDLFESTNELDTIRNLLQKKLRPSDDLYDLNTKNKIMSYLVRKGFPFSSIKSVIDEMLSSR